MAFPAFTNSLLGPGPDSISYRPLFMNFDELMIGARGEIIILKPIEELVTVVVFTERLFHLIINAVVEPSNFIVRSKATTVPRYSAVPTFCDLSSGQLASNADSISVSNRNRKIGSLTEANCSIRLPAAA